MLVQANLHLGRVEDAIRFADAAIEEMDASGELILAPEILRLGATAHLERDADTDVARRLLDRAVAIARLQGTLGLELRATMTLARILGEQGRRSEALERLAAVHEQFTEGFGTADLQEADSLLVSLA